MSRPPLRVLYDQLNAQLWAGALPPAQRVLEFGGSDARALGVNVRRVGVGVLKATRGLRCRGVRGFVAGVFRRPGELVIGGERAPDRYWPAEIRVLSPLGDTAERRVLLHEMCHAAVWVAGDEEQGHGPRFIAELDRLASLGEGGGGRGEPVSRARLCYDRPAAMNRAGAELVAYQPPRPCRLTSVPRKVQDGAH